MEIIIIKKTSAHYNVKLIASNNNDDNNSNTFANVLVLSFLDLFVFLASGWGEHKMVQQRREHPVWEYEYL